MSHVTIVCIYAIKILCTWHINKNIVPYLNFFLLTKVGFFEIQNSLLVLKQTNWPALMCLKFAYDTCGIIFIFLPGRKVESCCWLCLHCMFAKKTKTSCVEGTASRGKTIQPLKCLLFYLKLSRNYLWDTFLHSKESVTNQGL